MTLTTYRAICATRDLNRIVEIKDKYASLGGREVYLRILKSYISAGENVLKLLSGIEAYEDITNVQQAKP